MKVESPSGGGTVGATKYPVFGTPAGCSSPPAFTAVVQTSRREQPTVYQLGIAVYAGQQGLAGDEQNGCKTVIKRPPPLPCRAYACTCASKRSRAADVELTRRSHVAAAMNGRTRSRRSCGEGGARSRRRCGSSPVTSRAPSSRPRWMYARTCQSSTCRRPDDETQHRRLRAW